MAVQIPLMCVRRNRQTKEIVSKRPTKFELEFIYEPARESQEKKERIMRELMSATQSGFRRSNIQPNEVLERTFHPQIKVLILVKRKGKAVGYYSMEAMRLRVNGRTRHGIFLKASVLHRKAKGFGLMNAMQAAAVLMGKEHFRIKRKVAHFIAATTQKKEVARTLAPFMTKTEPDIWDALVRRLYPHVNPTEKDAVEGIVRGAYSKIGTPLYGLKSGRTRPEIEGLDPKKGDAILLVSKAVSLIPPQKGLRLARKARLHQIIHEEFRNGFLGQALRWSAPKTHEQILNPSKPQLPTLITAAIQQELAGSFRNKTYRLDPKKEPVLVQE